MNDWLKTLAPLLGTALGGPLGGAAAAFIADKLGIESKTVEAVTEVLNSGKMTPDQISAIKLAELDFKKFTETNKIDVMKVEAGDRDSARKANVAGGVQMPLFWLSLTLLILCLGSEIWILFNGYPEALPEMVVGRVLGLLDAVTLLVLTYWYGTTNSSAQKNQLLAQAAVK
jgi:gas vesicle protein